jgi:hypothetical protein
MRSLLQGRETEMLGNDVILKCVSSPTWGLRPTCLKPSQDPAQVGGRLSAAFLDSGIDADASKTAFRAREPTELHRAIRHNNNINMQPKILVMGQIYWAQEQCKSLLGDVAEVVVR